MKYHIVYSERFYEDLILFGDYIERMTFSKQKADLIITEILSSIDVLTIFPYLYQIFYKDFHFINIRNQRIVYYINEEKKEVIVYRLLGQAQNYEDIL